MYITKDNIKFAIEIVKAITLEEILLISYEIVAKIKNIPKTGIVNKDQINIK